MLIISSYVSHWGVVITIFIVNVKGKFSQRKIHVYIDMDAVIKKPHIWFSFVCIFSLFAVLYVDVVVQSL